jgi:hypothetical protein
MIWFRANSWPIWPAVCLGDIGFGLTTIIAALFAIFLTDVVRISPRLWI